MCKIYRRGKGAQWLTKRKENINFGPSDVFTVMLIQKKHSNITANASTLEIILFGTKVMLFLVYCLPIVLDNGLVFQKR